MFYLHGHAQMCTSWGDSFDTSIINIFDVFENYRGMVNRFDLDAKQAAGSFTSEALGEIIYVELNVHR